MNTDFHNILFFSSISEKQQDFLKFLFFIKINYMSLKKYPTTRIVTDSMRNDVIGLKMYYLFFYSILYHQNEFGSENEMLL